MAVVFAVMHLCNTLKKTYCFCPFLFSTEICIDKSTEWSMIPACSSLMCFFNKGDTEGTNFSKKICLMFLYVLCNFVSGLILWFSDNLWFDDLHAE